MRGVITTLAVTSLLLSGCAGHLETLPYRDRTETLSGALKGVTYWLPKAQYEVKLTRWLAECPNDAVDGKPTSLKFDVNVEATPRFVPGEAYEVDYNKLSGLFRTSSFEIKYWPNGNLKSIGAGAEDKTADVIKDTVKTALAVAPLAFGAPTMKLFGGPAGPPPPPPVSSSNAGVVCTPGAFDLVREARQATKDTKDSTKELARLTKAIERMQSRATLKLINQADRETLLTLFTAVDAEGVKIAAAKDRLAAAKEKLGVVDEFVWDSELDKAGDGQIRAYVLSDKQKAKLTSLVTMGQVQPLWVDEAEGVRRDLYSRCYSDDGAPDKCVDQQLSLRAVAQVQSSLPACGGGNKPPECVSSVPSTDPRYRAARDEVADSGVFVREPAQARLLFCRVAQGACTPKVDEAGLTAGSFPQLGQLRYLPLRVGMFQAREMALSLTEDGRVETFSYKSTKAPAQVLAAAAADVATQIETALEKRETEFRDDLKYAREQQTAQVEAEIKRLTKDLELKKAQDAFVEDPLKPIRDETAALQAEIALLQAKKAKLDAEKALAPIAG